MTRRASLLLLVLLALAAFSTAFGNGFTNWDDPDYITENRLVWGLSPDRVAAAFTSFHLYNYNPLHLVSYMVDHLLWGLDPRGYLFTNLLMHAGAGILVREILRRLGAREGVALLVAAVFLIHPTRCESVVWLSERKDVLSGLLAMASVLCFVTHLSRRGPTTPSWSFSAGAFTFFVAALLAKSQVVTLPAALWAIAIYRGRDWRRAALEQGPFLAVAVVFAVITLRAHAGSAEGAAGSIAGFSLVRPLAALPHYVAHLVWPLGLSPLYEIEPPGIADALPGLALVVAAAVAAVRSVRRRRVAFTGIVWFFALLLPVSGLLPNRVLVADRYLYVPIVGIAWVVFDALDVLAAGRLDSTRRSVVNGAAATAVVVALVAASASYATVWRDSGTLWRRVLDVAPASSVARANLGMHLLERGQIDEAERLFEEDLDESPRFAESFHGLARVRLAQGRGEEAIALLRRLCDLEPSARSRARLAAMALDAGGPASALAELDATAPTRDGHRGGDRSEAGDADGAPSSFALEQVRFRIDMARGRLAEARRRCLRSIERNRFHEDGWYHLGLVDERLGDDAGAMASYERAIACNPRLQEAHEALALALRRSGRPAEAVRRLERAPRVTASSSNLLAICRLAQGDVEGSLDAMRRAVMLDPANERYWANRARVALRARSLREARECVAVAAARDPGIVDALEPPLRELLGEPMTAEESE